MSSARDIVERCRKHLLFPWVRGAEVELLKLDRAQGVYLYTADGRRLIDFNSQLMNVLIGHGHPRVKEAIVRQLEQVAFVESGFALEVRARVGELIASLMPPSINKFFFTLGGSDANEYAVRMARQVTGRQKILSRYRSYHGSTQLALQLSGEPRTHASAPGAPGFVKVLDPAPYEYRFGEDEGAIVDGNLAYLEEVLRYEGPSSFAAMIIEPITGGNGVLIPPKGYLPRLKALLERHGILLICDEVMTGFGRTGKMFAFEHEGIVPDIVTLAKGLTSSYLPLGAVAVSDDVARYFDAEPCLSGLTNYAHPVCLAAAEACLEVLLEERLVENAARLEHVMRREMDRLAAAHPSVKEGRCQGLFGLLEFQSDASGRALSPYATTHPAMPALRKRLLEEGVFTFTRWSTLMTNPPLCISEQQLLEAFGVVDRALAVVDDAFRH